jgi:hypothetical protein
VPADGARKVRVIYSDRYIAPEGGAVALP